MFIRRELAEERYRMFITVYILCKYYLSLILVAKIVKTIGTMAYPSEVYFGVCQLKRDQRDKRKVRNEVNSTIIALLLRSDPSNQVSKVIMCIYSTIYMYIYLPNLSFEYISIARSAGVHYNHCESVCPSISN